MKYIILTIKHKWFVLIAGIRIGGIPILQLLMHDWTKFILWRAYNNQFFGDKSKDREFAEAWLKHQNTEKHHWEYWIPRSSHNKVDASMKDVYPLQMPERYVREMIADWLAAGRAYNGKWPDINNWIWLKENERRIFDNLHIETEIRIGQIIDELKCLPPL